MKPSSQVTCELLFESSSSPLSTSVDSPVICARKTLHHSVGEVPAPTPCFEKSHGSVRSDCGIDWAILITHLVPERISVAPALEGYRRGRFELWQGTYRLPLIHAKYSQLDCHTTNHSFLLVSNQQEIPRFIGGLRFDCLLVDGAVHCRYVQSGVLLRTICGEF